MLEVNYETLARAAHEINRAYCLGMGDASQPAWENAPPWQKESALLGVKKLLENPRLTPEDLHVSWLEQKVADGWVYGDVKDPVAKTHPCMVAYSQLPREQQVKDYLFRAAVFSTLTATTTVEP